MNMKQIIPFAVLIFAAFSLTACGPSKKSLKRSNQALTQAMQAMAMMFSLAACGKKDQPAGSQSTSTSQSTAAELTYAVEAAGIPRDKPHSRKPSSVGQSIPILKGPVFSTEFCRAFRPW